MPRFTKDAMTMRSGARFERISRYVGGIVVGLDRPKLFVSFGSGMAQHEPVAWIEALYRNEWPGSANSGPTKPTASAAASCDPGHSAGSRHRIPVGTGAGHPSPLCPCACKSSGVGGGKERRGPEHNIARRRMSVRRRPLRSRREA
jgi:hypothetical protein